ncbi:MAG: hypothetical protein WAT39_00120 [Planctomycetota bacterium]
MNPTRLLAPGVLFLLAPFAVAQLQSGMPAPLPGTPATPPPVDHPALGAQPLFGDGGGSRRPTPAPEPDEPDVKDKPGKAKKPKVDPDTFGPKLEGRDMKKAVAAVKALKWHESLGEAKAISAATGKPILWLQALGDIDGFA